MFKRLFAAAAIAGMAIGPTPVAARSQTIDVIMALPAQTLTFTSVYVAEDMG